MHLWPHSVRDTGFELNADDMLEGLPPFYPGGNGVHDFQHECQIWTHLTQSISNEPWTSRHNGASGPYSHMASFLHDRALVLEVFLGPFSNVNDRIMPMSDAASSEGRRPQASNKGLCNLTLRYVVFKVFHNLFTHTFTVWRASAHLYFWETLPL